LARAQNLGRSVESRAPQDRPPRYRFRALSIRKQRPVSCPRGPTLSGVIDPQHPPNLKLGVVATIRLSADHRRCNGSRSVGLPPHDGNRKGAAQILNPSVVQLNEYRVTSVHPWLLTLLAKARRIDGAVCGPLSSRDLEVSRKLLSRSMPLLRFKTDEHFESR
jgi:hypothetical protein